MHRLGDAPLPKRLRWCLAVAPFDKAAFRNPVKTPKGTVWVAIDRGDQGRALVCTPWYDVAAARFEG